MVVKACLVCCMSLGAAVAGFKSNTMNFPIVARPPNPVPGIARIDVQRTAAGGLLLTVIGESFGTGSVISLDGHDRPTTYLPGTALTTVVTGKAVTAGAHVVSVYNRPPGGGDTAGYEVNFVYDLSGHWTGTWPNNAGFGRALEITLKVSAPALTSRGESYSGSLSVTGSDIVSQCGVYAFNSGLTVSLTATCEGYMGLIYTIQYTGNVDNPCSLDGTWNLSTSGVVLDSGAFRSNHVHPKSTAKMP